jgi:hypothetical protein
MLPREIELPIDRADAAHERCPFYVDMPTIATLDSEEQTWEAIGRFNTRAEALAFIREHLAAECDDQGRICLLSGGVEEGNA